MAISTFTENSSVPLESQQTLLINDSASFLGKSVIRLNQAQGETEKAFRIALAFFALSASAVLAGSILAFTMPTVGLIVLGIGALGALASAVHTYASYSDTSLLKKWENCFKMFCENRFEEGMKHMDEMLDSRYTDYRKYSLEDLKTKFSYPYCTRKEQIIDSEAMHILYSTGASAGLPSSLSFWYVLNQLQKPTSSVPFSELRVHTTFAFKELVHFAPHLFNLLGMRLQNQGFNFEFIEPAPVSQMRAAAQQIQIPKKISIGHSFLYELVSDQRSEHPRYPGLPSHTPEELDKKSYYLAALKANLEAGREWMEKEGVYGELEKRLTEEIQAKKTFKQVFQFIKALPQNDIESLKKRSITF